MDNYELKYTVAYRNISGDDFLLEIFQKSDFTFDENQIAGAVIYTKGSVDDIFEPIRPTTLTINLEASQTNVLEDFQSFNEFDFKVKFYRNSLQIFEGWINPDGWFQDWVNDKWEISMTAVDGLGTLKNLEFTDEDEINTVFGGVPFRYAPREINYLHAALKRLEYELPYTIGDDINVDLGVPVDWIDVNKRIIDRNVFINDNGTFQDCETILKDILQKYNLTITQENIEGRLVWYISRVIYAAYPDAVKRNRQYNTTLDVSGGSESVEVILQQFAFADGHPNIKTVYSEINTINGLKPDAIHCNENQQITFNPALQNFRFQSNWKGQRNFYNGMNSWEEIPPMPVGFFKTDDYLRMYNVWEPDLINDPWFVAEIVRQPTDEVNNISLVYDWWVDYQFMNPVTTIPDETKLQFMLKNTDGSDIYYYNLDNESWQSAPVVFEIVAKFPSGINTIGIVEGTTNVILPKGLGDLYEMFVYSPYSLAEVQHEVRVYNVDFLFVTDVFGTGKVHDSTQPEVKSTFLNDPVDVINTNEPNAYFQNNLYREAFAPEIITGLIPMNKWKAFDTPQYSDLLELTGRERIRAKAKPQRLFRGDIFGFIPYSSVIRYNGIGGNFVALSYQYRTVENIIELECSQIFNEDVTINHEKKYIFENEKNVLIKEL